MQEATIEVESNLLASNQLKAEEERGSTDKREVKEERQASTSKAFATEDKLDEMSNIIKHLASKMSKLELENRITGKPIQEGVNRNSTPLRRPFQPTQILQCPRKNLEDQNVQHPLNNFVDENQHEEEDEVDDIK